MSDKVFRDALEQIVALRGYTGDNMGRVSGYRVAAEIAEQALRSNPPASKVAGYRRRLPEYAFEHYEFEQPDYESPSMDIWQPLYVYPPCSTAELSVGSRWRAFESALSATAEEGE